jgi:putative SOS response-associated peptidase YedK
MHESFSVVVSENTVFAGITSPSSDRRSAGLFPDRRPRKGSPHLPLDTFSIFTTEANELMEPIHNRMPVILHPRDYDRWPNDCDESRPPIDLLRPYEADGMRMTPANRLVGNVHNNGPAMLNSA